MKEIVQKRLRELETLNEAVKTFQKGDSKACGSILNLNDNFHFLFTTIKKLSKRNSVNRSQASHRRSVASNVSISSTET